MVVSTSTNGFIASVMNPSANDDLSEQGIPLNDADAISSSPPSYDECVWMDDSSMPPSYSEICKY